MVIFGQKRPPLKVDFQVISLLEDPRVRVKYQQLITDSFVQCNRTIRWGIRMQLWRY